MGRGLREKGTGNHESDPKMLWYLGNIWDYGLQMLPSALAAAAVFFCLRPWRRRRLAALGLTSGPWREGALLLFAAFCAGLAALTLTPPNFWTCLFHGVPIVWPASGTNHFYWKLTVFRDLAGGPWVFFMLLGNLGMFAPLGFFPALLWDRPGWKKALLTGVCSSLFVEITPL